LLQQWHAGIAIEQAFDFFPADVQSAIGVDFCIVGVRAVWIADRGGDRVALMRRTVK
jgi:hypothetical protein